MKKKTLKKSTSSVSLDYINVLLEIKQHIYEAQIKAVFSVNKELLKLYWIIGQTIYQKQKMNGWGSQSVEKLAQDIQREFPGLEGFSRSNIFRIQAFFTAYKLVAQPVRQLDDLPIFNIPWGHNITILQSVKNVKQRLWYAQKSIEHGWSRAVLSM